jgi:pimeloyl-ACP methyl ester carboxylesterase
VLHERGGDAVSAVERARSRFGRRADISAPQAARPCNPFQSNLRGASGYEGYSWYLGDEPERPEAASFGDALAELEMFVAALGRPFVLAGRGQGAVLAMTLALHAPGGLAGVWCEDGGLAQLDGWTLPESSVPGVPFVLEGLDDIRISRARDAIESRGARVLVSAAEQEAWLETLTVPDVTT